WRPLERLERREDHERAADAGRAEARVGGLENLGSVERVARRVLIQTEQPEERELRAAHAHERAAARHVAGGYAQLDLRRVQLARGVHAVDLPHLVLPRGAPRLVRR